MQRLVLLLSLMTISLIPGAEPYVSAPVLGADQISMQASTTFDRIRLAADLGQISLKDAVILEARLLFAPQTIPPESPFAPRPGETRVREDCLTGFYKDVHRVLPQMSPEQRKWLASLSPDLQVIVLVYEKESQSPRER
jgi:hypothetical protein